MVRQKTQATISYNNLLNQAVLGVQSGKYKCLYKAGKLLGLCKETIAYCVNGGFTHSQASQQQQKLSYAQEKILLK